MPQQNKNFQWTGVSGSVGKSTEDEGHGFGLVTPKDDVLNPRPLSSPLSSDHLHLTRAESDAFPGKDPGDST